MEVAQSFHPASPLCRGQTICPVSRAPPSLGSGQTMGSPESSPAWQPRFGGGLFRPEIRLFNGSNPIADRHSKVNRKATVRAESFGCGFSAVASVNSNILQVRRFGASVRTQAAYHESDAGPIPFGLANALSRCRLRTAGITVGPLFASLFDLNPAPRMTSWAILGQRPTTREKGQVFLRHPHLLI